MSDRSVEPLILHRDFKAPMKLVYETWTREEHLCRWQVPNGKVTCEYKFADIREGGEALHRMLMPNGNAMWLLTRYHELQPHHTIVFTQYQSNENGEIIQPPMPNWPKEIRVTLKLSETNGITSMTFTWQPINPSREEAEAWLAASHQAGNGWAGSFELLAGYLAKI